LHYPAVIAPEQIIVAQHGPARGEDGDFLTGRKRGTQAAVLAQLVRKHELRENRIRLRYLGI
jgi:hypothetical protein